jgi:hypothetical protein
MAKQGQHKNDSFDQTKSPGHNKPKETTPITAGTPKKRSTTERQASEHKDPHKQGQVAKNAGNPERIDHSRTAARGLRARSGDITGGRSGSDSGE